MNSFAFQQTEMPAVQMSPREYRGVRPGSWRAATCVPWACSHGTSKRGTERELSGLERSAHKRKTIKVFRALRVAPREGRASLGTEGSVEPGGPSVTTPGETLAAAFRSVKLLFS